MEITDNRIKKGQSIKTVTTVLLLLVGLTSIFPLTAMANNAPTFNGAIRRAILMATGDKSDVITIDVSGYFSDSDGDRLSYTAASADTGVATATMSGAKVKITRVAAGTTVVAVTASDSELTATQLIDVRVYDQASEAPRTVEDTTLMLPVGGGTATIDISDGFSDTNFALDQYSWTIGTLDKSKATGALSRTRNIVTVTITPHAQGETWITVQAEKKNDFHLHHIGVGVMPTNRAPAANGTISPVTANVGANPATVDVSSKFNDPDGNPLTYTAVSSDTTKATVSMSGSTVSITPVAKGTVTVTVRASDGKLTAQRTIAVTVPNRAPVPAGIIPPVTAYLGGGAVDVDVASKFVDPDGDTLAYTATSSPSGVVVATVSGETVKITGVRVGTATVTVTASDGKLTAQRTVVVTVSNRAPMAFGTIAPITLNTDGTATTVDVSSKFTDPDGDTLTYTAVSSDTTKATVSVSGANLTITPVAKGTATVTVTASDGKLTATQTIAVTVPNRAPVVKISVRPINLSAGTQAHTQDLSTTFSDPEGDRLSYTAVSADTSRVMVSVSGAVVSITPVAIGSATVTVTASDGKLTATQSFTVTVSANNAPMAVGTISPVTVNVGASAATVDVSGKFSDPDGNFLSYTAESSDTTKVTARMSGTVVSLAPVAVGTSTVTVTASDGGLTAQQTIAVTVPNRAPVLTALTGNVTAFLGGGTTDVDVSSKFRDPDGQTLTYTATSDTTGVATVAVSGTVVKITPVAVGGTTVTVAASDGSLTATHLIVVTVPNRTPVGVGIIDPVTVKLGGSAAEVDVSSKFSDPDGQTLIYTAVSSNTVKATVSVSGAVVKITPVAEGSATVTVTASDSRATASQTIVVVVVPNRAPTAVGTINPVSVSVNGNPAAVDVSSKFRDPDGDALTYTAVSANAAVVTVNMINSTLTITPVAAGTTIVMVVVQDTNGLTVTRTVTVTVLSAPNRAPVAVGTIDPIALTVGAGDQTVDLSSHFSDPDGDSLSYTATSSDATKATVSVSDSTLTISPVAAGATTVIVIAQDTDGLTVTQNITVAVFPRPNRAPVAGTVNPITLTVGEADQTVNLSSHFSDPDDDDLTYSAQSADTNIVTVAVEGSTLKLTPIVEGTTTVMIVVQDTSGLTITQTITVTVNPVPNAVPTFTSAIAFSVIENITTVGTVTAVDSDSEDAITGYAVTGGDDGVRFSIDPLSGELSFNTAPDFETPEDASGTNHYILVVQAVSGTGDRALTADQTITVTVTDGNDAPLAIGTIDPVTLIVGDEDQTVDVSGKFSDPDDDDLTYSALSADTTVAQVTVEDTIVTITPVEAGTTTVTVTAIDPGSLTATQPIAVTVDVVAGLVNAASSLMKLDATMSAVIDSTALMQVNPNWTVANGDTLTLTVDVGFEGLEVMADISALDSTQSFVSLTSDRNGVYTARIRISEDNTALNGLKHILVTARDEVGNFTQLIVSSTLNNRYVTELLPNYPNPFNPETWIPYRLGKDAEVTLTIYDARGDVVRQFDLGFQPAGAYDTRSRAVYWNGTNDFGETVANGVYFYSLSTNDYSRTRKATILK